MTVLPVEGTDRGPGLDGGRRRGPPAAGVVIGLALFAGYGFQTVGLQYTTASNAGFITGLSVVLTPCSGPCCYARRRGGGR